VQAEDGIPFAIVFDAGLVDEMQWHGDPQA
jgi:hypothetical protein